MFDNANIIYIIEEVKGGGLKRYIDDFKNKYSHKKIQNINTLENIIFEKNDVLFIQNLYFTTIEINEILKLEIKIILCLHDFYWIHEFVMRDFFDENYPPVHTNYLRKNIIINNDIKKLFKKAYKIIYPSNFVYENYQKYFDTANFLYVPHDDNEVNYSNNLIIKIKNNVINIGVLHCLTKCKGCELILFLKNNVKLYENYEIKFLTIGENIEKYDENDDIKNIIEKYNINFVTCLNIWGETYSYYLTKIINAGIPILYNNIGSFKERIPENKKYIKVFENENDVYNYDFLKIKFCEMLDYIIRNNCK